MNKPDPRDIFENYIKMLESREDYEKQVEVAQNYYKQFPNDAQSLLRLSDALININKLKEAYDYAEKLTSDFPKNPKGWNQLGLLCEIYLKDYKKAKECYQKSLEIEESLSTYYNLAINSVHQNDMETALKYSEKIYKEYPDDYGINYLTATIYLYKRDYKKGSEFMLKSLKNNPSVAYSILKNHWSGEENKTETLLVYGDNGFGDMFMCSRYLNTVSKYFKTIKLVIPEEVFELFRQSFSNIDNLEFYHKENELPEYDKSVLLSAIPFIIGFEDIPNSDKYLTENEQITTNYKQIISTSKKKIGLCWEAGHDSIRDLKNRTIDLSCFESLIKNENVQIYSLQTNPKTEDYKQYNIIDLGKDFKNFNDTAGAIKNLDFVVTVDTSVAHLAGALGVKTCLLLPYCADWRWFDNNKSTEWYNSVTIYKQTNPKTWEDVINKVVQNITDM